MSTHPAFQAALDRLHAEQRQAVETIEGPLMVLAGPGTGKTEVVGVRVGNILKKTHARPGNILCLTFSTSGATAMRERLRRLIGADAYGVAVTTIHGFCNDLILSHADLFTERRLEQQATDVRRFRIVNAIIDGMPAGSVMINPKDPYARTGDILTRISQCKREGISIQSVLKLAQQYAIEMKEKSRPGTKAQAQNERRGQQFLEFASIYEKYELALIEEEIFDYDDMISLATKAMIEEEWLISGLQERYQYIIVDEYQDTNGAQNAFIQALTTLPEAAGDPNLCVVGDDDQAIYRFQGANVTGMLQFRDRFPGAPIVVLSQSYRSTQQILDAATNLIGHNEERFVGRVPGVTKILRSAAKEQTGPVPSLIRPVSDAVEPFAIAEIVEQVLKEDVPPGEIAIFTRSNGELFALYDVLRGRGVAVQISGKMNLLQSEVVLQAIAILRAVSDLRADHHLASAIGAACFNCHPADLARLWTLRRELAASRPGMHVVDVLAELETIEAAATFHDLSAILRARDLLLGLRSRVDTLTLPALVERVLHESGLIPADADGIDPLTLVALSEFFAHVKERGAEDRHFGLPELLADLEYRQEYGLPLRYAIPHLIDDGVQLMTAHGSKGLEFDTVIVANFREKHWDHRRPLTGLALPEELIFGASLSEGLEDERRLAYVAWTRAKRRLILSCPERVVRGDREQDVSPSAFAVEGGPLPESVHELSEPTRANLLLVEKPEIDGALESYLRSRLETYELSVTALNHFLEDPVLFLRQDLLGLPQAKTANLSYGTAIHEGLREWAKTLRDDGRSDQSALLRGFERGLKHETLIEKDLDRLLHLGQEALPVFFAARLQEKPILLGIEQSLSARLGEVRLKGKLDRIDLYHEGGAKVKVIDYKTGRPKTEREVREGDNGNLYRQLVFYKLLIEHSTQMLGYEPVEFVLDFVGERDEAPVSLSFPVPETDARELRTLIERVWAKIFALDFTPLA